MNRLCFRRVVTCLIAVVLCLVACQPPDKGPKREDHKAAHTRRYHPDVKQNVAGTSDAASQPSETLDQFQWSVGPVGSPVMFANGEAVSVEEILEPLYEYLTRQSEALGEVEYRDLLLRTTRRQIDLEISNILIYQEAQREYSEQMLEQFDKIADRRIKDIINRRFGGVHARYEEHLKKLNLSVDHMKERQKRHVMVIEFLRSQLRPLLRQPSRDELVQEFEARKDEFASPAKAELFLIEVPVRSELENKSPSQATSVELAEARKRARQRIVRAQEELASGVEFPAVAKAYSRGLGKSNGGAVGEISPGSLAQPYQEPDRVLFDLGENQISDIIETDDSFFLVKCGKKTPTKEPSFEEAQAKLTENLLDRQFDERRAEYIVKLWAKGTIEKYQEFQYAVFAAAPRPPKYRSPAENNDNQQAIR